MSSSSYQICDLFKNTDSQLGKILQQAKALTALDQVFNTCLAPELVEHCQVGHYAQGVLTFYTESAGYATRIRYSAMDLLSKLRAMPQWAGLVSIQVKVKTFDHKVEAKPEPVLEKLEISANVAEQLQGLIEKLQGQKGAEKLVASLKRLAKG
jgi:hypothetical protein